MAFQTNVLRNGEWVSKTVDIQTFFAGDDKSSPANPAKSRESPTCGVLTRTVVESPAVHEIIPVRLRSSSHNDVAFISDYYVEIKEFRDGQLHHVARKNDFGLCIQAAAVLGSFYDPSTATHEDDVDMTESQHLHQEGGRSQSQHVGLKLPPQVLVLLLGLGRFVFLFLREDPNGSVDFVCSHVSPPSNSAVWHSPGPFQLAIDPSSHYMAVSAAGNQFLVYELALFEALLDQYQNKGSIEPIVSCSGHPIRGKIHKMEFLFPQPQDDESVILCFVILSEDGEGTTVVVTYDWEFGDDLGPVFYEKGGFKLGNEHKMPLLLIPLTVNISLLFVFENSIVVCPEVVVGGTSKLEDVEMESYPASEHHIGRRPPLWTAWARPLRRKDFFEKHDHIYLAREDGSIFYLESTPNTNDNIESTLKLAQTKTSIFKAFAVIGTQLSDVLVIGGNFGGGTVWEVGPREKPRIIGSIPNWSPALDFATTDQFLSWNQPIGHGDDRPAIMPWRKRSPRDAINCDRLFTTAGRGIDGSIVEHRQGIPAAITIDLDHEIPLHRIWGFADSEGGLTVLLSYHSSSVVQHIPNGEEIDMEDVGEQYGFDTASRTLAATKDPEICQVTETSISIIGPSQRTRLSLEHILGIAGVRAENACIRGELVAFSTMSTQDSAGFQIHIMDRAALPSTLRTHHLELEPTCIEFCVVRGQRHILAVLWQIDHTSVCLYPVDTDGTGPVLEIRILAENGSDSNGLRTTPSTQLESPIQAITSLAVIYESEEKTVVIGGSRGGFLVTMEITSFPDLGATCRVDHVSSAPVEVVATADAPAPVHSVLACWDTDVVLFKDYDVHTGKHFRGRERLIPVRMADLPGSMEDVEIFKTHSVAYVPCGSSDNPLVLMAANSSRLLVTSPGNSSELLPRQMPLGCQPLRVIYSHSLQCLVVAVVCDNAPTLMFVDPNTGKLESRPKGSNGEEDRDFVKGLGQDGDRIHALHEWIYEKSGERFAYLLAGTQTGRLIVISAEWKGREIHYKTRFKTDSSEQPVHSIMAQDENIFLGCGSTIHWEYLDSVDKRLRSRAKIEADSPVMSISISREGTLFAVTLQDSLQAISLKVAQEEEHVAMSDAGHLDPVKRRTTHMMELGDSEGGQNAWPIALVSDRDSQVAGLWATGGGAHNGRHLEMLFGGAVPAMVRKFGRAHTRPAWWRLDSTPRFGRIASTVDDAEIFGACLDGSMQHVIVLDKAGWRFLRLINNLGVRNAYKFLKGREKPRQKASSEPDMKRQSHIDGDFLKILLDKGALGFLLETPDDVALFKECLDGLDGGQWTNGFEGDDEEEKYMGLAYDVIRYFLRPVF